MQIQINTDHNINDHAPPSARLSSVIEHSLGHCSHYIADLDVHLSDPHAAQPGEHDKRCTIEASLGRRRSRLVVTHEAASLEQAAEGATRKLAHMIGRTLDRMRTQQRRTPADTQHP